MQDEKADIAMIGCGVMGSNLVVNFSDKGFSVVVYSVDENEVDKFFIKEVDTKRKNIFRAGSIEELVAKLAKPRKVMLMITTGAPVDDMIKLLVDHLEPGDIIIDGGNSHYQDTGRRLQYAESKSLLYIGAGISGGEDGARNGPSIMPGGSSRAWPLLQPFFTIIAAKAPDGSSCCEWIGPGGAGHFVKMIHNGIEYGIMQLIAEAYQYMKTILYMNDDEIRAMFACWNNGELSGYLIESTAEVLSFKDDDGKALVGKIVDKTEQKGTGKWSSVSSLDLGIPASVITEAVFARYLSALKEERVHASGKLASPPIRSVSESREKVLDDLRTALLASEIITYTQGFMLLREASRCYSWNLGLASLAHIWSGGCIIRSSVLARFEEAFRGEPELKNALLDEQIGETLCNYHMSLRATVAEVVRNGVPAPAFSSALAFYDGYRCAVLPANLLQGLRDYFGGHGFERIDRPEGTVWHLQSSHM